MNRSQGFTLVELMVVVSIIGVLAIIAIPIYQNFIARAQLIEAVTILEAYSMQTSEMYASASKCTDSQSPEVFYQVGRYIDTVTIDSQPKGCRISLRFKSSITSDLLVNKHVILSFTSNNTGYNWQCSSPDIDTVILKNICQ